MEAESAGLSETSDETDDSLSDSGRNQRSTSELSSGEADEPSRPQEDLPAEAPDLDIESGGEQDSSGVASYETRQEKFCSDIASPSGASREFAVEGEEEPALEVAAHGDLETP